MAAQIPNDALTQPHPRNIQSSQRSASAPAAGLRQQKWRQEQEKEWDRHLRKLQQCICDLLIKNQQLRQSLESTIGRPHLEAENEQ
jgi:hypothetical protein